jgi:hypothetical protein
MDVFDALAFLVPFTLFIELQIVGRLFVPEVLLATMFPALLMLRGRMLTDPLPRIFLLLAGLWLLGQVLTDFVEATPFFDYSRGWAKIGFTMVNFCALFLLLNGRPRRIVLYATGLAVGGIVEYFVNPSVYAASDPWKFGYGVSVTWFLVLSAIAVAGQSWARWFIAIGLILGTSAFNVAMGFRNLGGVLFLTAAYMAAQAVWRKPKTSPRRIRARHAVVLTAALGIVAWGALEIYSRAAESGLLGYEAQQLYQSQATGAYGLLLGGRSEALVSIPAILDAPILGHGSWAKDCDYASLLVELKRELGYFAGDENEECLIPAHSHLLGAWVESGILGALFWAWVLSVVVRALLQSFVFRQRLSPLIAFVGFLLIWDILFSPYGASRRFVTPFFVIVMMICVQAFRSIRHWQHDAPLLARNAEPRHRPIS